MEEAAGLRRGSIVVSQACEAGHSLPAAIGRYPSPVEVLHRLKGSPPLRVAVAEHRQIRHGVVSACPWATPNFDETAARSCSGSIESPANLSPKLDYSPRRMCRLCDDDRQVTGTTAPARNDFVDLAQDAVAFLAPRLPPGPLTAPNKRTGSAGHGRRSRQPGPQSGGRALRGHALK